MPPRGWPSITLYRLRTHHVQGAGCRVQGSGSRSQGSGLRAQGAGFRVQGAATRVALDNAAQVANPSQIFRGVRHLISVRNPEGFVLIFRVALDNAAQATSPSQIFRGVRNLISVMDSEGLVTSHSEGFVIDDGHADRAGRGPMHHRYSST